METLETLETSEHHTVFKIHIFEKINVKRYSYTTLWKMFPKWKPKKHKGNFFQTMKKILLIMKKKI
jgi:hypothetical protein